MLVSRGFRSWVGNRPFIAVGMWTYEVSWTILCIHYICKHVICGAYKRWVFWLSILVIFHVHHKLTYFSLICSTTEIFYQFFFFNFGKFFAILEVKGHICPVIENNSDFMFLLLYVNGIKLDYFKIAYFFKFKTTLHKVIHISQIY